MTRRNKAWGFTVGIALVLFVGCGGLVSSGRASASTAAPQPVRFGLTSLTMNYPAVIVGEALGTFKKYNIDLQRSLVPTSAAQVAAIQSGSLDIANTATDAAVLLESKLLQTDKNPAIQILLPIVTGTNFNLLVDPSIKSLQDLKGKVIGVSSLNTADGGVAQTIMNTVNLRVGTDYTLSLVGSPAARTAALQGHQIAAALLPQPDTALLKAQGFKVLLVANSIPALKAGSFLSLIVNAPWAKKHPGAVVNFIKAWREALAVTYDPKQRSKVVDILSAALSIDDAFVESAYKDWVINQKIFPLDCHVDLKALAAVAQQQVALGALTGAVPAMKDLVIDPLYCNNAMKKPPVKKPPVKKKK